MQLWTVRQWLIGVKSGGSTYGTDSPQHALGTVSDGYSDCSAMVHVLAAIMRGRNYA